MTSPRRPLALLATAVLATSLGAASLAAAEPVGTPPDAIRSAPGAPYHTIEYADRLADSAHGHPDHDHGAKLNRRSAITASVPETVEVSTSIPGSGVVKVRAGDRAKRRPVRLLEATPSGWTVRVRKLSRRTGAFYFAVRAGSLARTRTFQVRAPRFDGLPAARTARLPVSVVAPTPSPEPEPTTSEPAAVGQPDDWSFVFSGGGARWNPCTTIKWAYNPHGGYAGSLDHVREALAGISQRSGLTFAYVGETTHVEKTGTAFPADADLAVAWSDEDAVAALAGGVVGIGGGYASTAPAGSDVSYRIVRGFVVLDHDHALREGFDTSGTATWGQVVQHELLHALGLGHAQGAEQVMHGSVSSLNHRFGAGDLGGMTRVGATQGCL